jgi:DNA-binding transcriptional ArsR family regulator
MQVRALKKNSGKHAPLGEAQIEAVAQLFATLSEPTRLRILQLLQEGPASVGEIVDTLGLKQANASKQLGILYQADVLAREKEGNTVRYSIRMPLVFDLCGLVCNALRAEAEAQLKQFE